MTITRHLNKNPLPAIIHAMLIFDVKNNSSQSQTIDFFSKITENVKSDVSIIVGGDGLDYAKIIRFLGVVPFCIDSITCSRQVRMGLINGVFAFGEGAIDIPAEKEVSVKIPVGSNYLECLLQPKEQVFFIFKFHYV